MMKSEVCVKTVKSRFKGYIGLCAKSGSLKYGSEVCLNEIKKNGVQLIVISDKASDRTKKMFSDKCRYYDVNLIELDEEIIQEATGRTGNKVFGVTNKGLAKEIAGLEREFRGCNRE